MVDLDFGDERHLLKRLQSAIKNNEKLTVLLGSGLTSPKQNPYQPGVSSVNEIIAKIKNRLEKTDSLNILEEDLAAKGKENEYQTSMKVLLKCEGQDALNEIITDAVLRSRVNSEVSVEAESISHELLEHDLDSWSLRTGVTSLAKLFINHKNTFVGPILTTNFDPLIQVAIRKNGGKTHTVFLPTDGLFDNVRAEGIPVVHFHGYWHGSDTLHTSEQITRDRPQLKGCLRKLLSDTTLLVVAYGGWNDVLTQTLIEIVKEGGSYKNILWAFYSDSSQDIAAKNKDLIQSLQGAIGQRVVLYKGIDTDIIFSKLIEDVQLKNSDTKTVEPPKIDQKEISFSSSNVFQCDPPPDNNYWVGREKEITNLKNKNFKSIFITGIGGQGKSGLASFCVRSGFDNSVWEYWDWRDCKEESNRLHTKIISIIERVSNGKTRSYDLVDTGIDALVSILFDHLTDRRILFVFDNVDHYIDLETFQPTGALSILYNAALRRTHKSQFIFTCRPEIRIVSSDVLLIPLAGLSFEETSDLFRSYNLGFKPEDLTRIVNEVHLITNGHPLWINIIAGQAKRGKDVAERFIDNIKTNHDEHSTSLGEITLNAVWKDLNYKQQIMLRGIAETVKPEVEGILEKILDSELNPNQFSKSLRQLKSLNLIVTRPLEGRKEVLDLHPLVKYYIKNKYPKVERSKYITLFVNYYHSVIIVLKKTLSHTSPLSDFENWTSKIELEITKDDFKSSLASLQEISDPILIAGFNEEYLRISTKLFTSLDWRSAIVEEYRYFHEQFREYIKVLVEWGRYGDVELFLDKYVKLIPGKSVHYISYCDLNCYYHWYRGDFDKAISWGENGDSLKKSASLEFSYLDHNLALAYRDKKDSKNLETATNFFLKGETIENILSENATDPNLPGAYFGNLGRCLEFQDKKEEALFCYSKSYSLLINESISDTKLNLGYACLWISGLLERLDQKRDSYFFLKNCYYCWERITPPRAQSVSENLNRISISDGFDNSLNKLSSIEIEHYCNDWVKRNLANAKSSRK